jgi:hypothetical protein
MSNFLMLSLLYSENVFVCSFIVLFLCCFCFVDVAFICMFMTFHILLLPLLLVIYEPME